MKIELGNLHEGSCNFCDKGKLNESQNGLIYPYQKVFTFVKEGNGLKPRMCEECMRELIDSVINNKYKTTILTP